MGDTFVVYWTLSLLPTTYCPESRVSGWLDTRKRTIQQYSRVYRFLIVELMVVPLATAVLPRLHNGKPSFVPLLQEGPAVKSMPEQTVLYQVKPASLRTQAWLEASESD